MLYEDPTLEGDEDKFTAGQLKKREDEEELKLAQDRRLHSLKRLNNRRDSNYDGESLASPTKLRENNIS